MDGDNVGSELVVEYMIACPAEKGDGQQVGGNEFAKLGEEE